MLGSSSSGIKLQVNQQAAARHGVKGSWACSEDYSGLHSLQMHAGGPLRGLLIMGHTRVKESISLPETSSCRSQDRLQERTGLRV